jgi:hypothetical protein
MPSPLARLLDITIGFAFAMFVLVSLSTELPVCLGEPVLPTSQNFFVRVSHHWGAVIGVCPERHL